MKAYCSQCGEAISENDQLAEDVGYCRHCGVVVSLSTANAAYIPQDAPKSGSRVGGVLKWTGIGCAGFVGLVLLLAIIGAIIADTESSTEETNQTSSRTSSEQKTARTVIVAPDPTILSPSDRERLTRWKQTFTHWDDIEAFHNPLTTSMLTASSARKSPPTFASCSTSGKPNTRPPLTM